MMILIFERAYLERHKTPEIAEHFWPGWGDIVAGGRSVVSPFRKYWGIFDGEGRFGAYDKRFGGALLRRLDDGLLGPDGV